MSQGRGSGVWDRSFLEWKVRQGSDKLAEGGELRSLMECTWGPFGAGLQICEGLCRECVCFWFLSWTWFQWRLMWSWCGVLNFLHARVTWECSEIPKSIGHTQKDQNS